MFYQAQSFVDLELGPGPSQIRKGLPDLKHSDRFEVSTTFRIECAIFKFSASLCSKRTLLLALAVRFNNECSKWKFKISRKKINALLTK